MNNFIRKLLISGLVLSVLSAPLINKAEAGQNPNTRLAMHLIASDEYLDSFDFRNIEIADIDDDLSLAELALTGYSGFCVLCAYNFEGISGIEFALSGWPNGEGQNPPLPQLRWEPEDYSEFVGTLGDHWNGGGATSWGSGYGGCETSGERVRESFWLVWNNHPVYAKIYPFAYFPIELNNYTDKLPITLNFINSPYSDPNNPRIYTLDCSIQFEEDYIDPYHTYSCTIGCDGCPTEKTTWSGIKSMYKK